MDSLRLVATRHASRRGACCRCRDRGGPWDRIAGRPYCPNCQEALAQGTADPLILSVEKRPCSVCGHLGVVCFLTFPLGWSQPIEIDLCVRHFRDLLGRHLDSGAFQHLRKELHRLHLSPHKVFLLHEAFYDSEGQALQPALDLD